MLQRGFQTSKKIIERRLRQRHNQLRVVGTRIAHSKCIPQPRLQALKKMLDGSAGRGCTKVLTNRVAAAEPARGRGAAAPPEKQRQIGKFRRSVVQRRFLKEIIGLLSVRM